MYYGVTKSPNNFQEAETLVVGCFDGDFDKSIPLQPENLNQLTTISQSGIKKGQSRCLYTSEGKPIVYMNCGDAKEYNLHFLKTLIKAIFALPEVKQAETVSIALPNIDDLSPAEMAYHLVIQSDYNLYRFDQFKSDTDNSESNDDQSIQFYLPEANENDVNKAIALTKGVRLTRDLGNFPANVCTPTYLANTARELEKHYPALSCKVLGRAQMQELGMNLLLSVSQGSDQEPQLIEMSYHNNGNEAPIVLVGKGVTFDSGGYSLKPGNAMDEMKYDMCGAASVIGVMKAVAEAKLPVNVIGIAACTENLINGKATKPGDIFTSMSGKTVEVINTDAEGRLVLADALTYVEQFKPSFVVDIATLTGAMVISLGDVYTGVLSNDDDLANNILTASEKTQDLCWRIPMHKDYESILDSPIADIANASWNRSAGSITASCFLSNFTKSYRWAHCDIAGTAWQSGKNKIATGRPVAMLFQLIEDAISS